MLPVRQSKLHHVRLRLRSCLLTTQFTVLFQEQRELSRIIRPFSSFHSFTRSAIRMYRIALVTKSIKTNCPRKIYIYQCASPPSPPPPPPNTNIIRTHVIWHKSYVAQITNVKTVAYLFDQMHGIENTIAKILRLLL